MTTEIERAIGERWIEYRAIKDLPPALANPKLHDREGIRRSITRFGFTSGVLLDERTGRLVAGHGRADVVAEMEHDGADVPAGIVVDDYGVWTVPVQRGWASETDDEAQAYLLADNRLTESGGWDEAGLAEILQRLAGVDETLMSASGFDREDLDDLLRRLADLGDTSEGDRGPAPTLADRFLAPPFDILDARQGWWRARKQQWMSLGIRSEIGREAADGDEKQRRPGALLLKSDSGRDSDYYRKKQAVEARLGRTLTTEEFQRDYYVAEEGNGGVSDSGTSVFDPVLCELVYRWYSPPGGTVLDPFAGGSVRGIVAALLGRDYTGVDLSAAQVAANDAQVTAIVGAPTAPAEPVETVEVTLPDWQHGYDLDGLRAVTRLFAEYDEGLVLGGFTGVRENNIAEWAADGALAVLAADGRPVTAVVARLVTRPQPVTDFAGAKRVTIPAGAIRIDRMACAPGYEGALLDMIRAITALAPSAPLWVESWTEHPVDRAIVDALDLQTAAVKIRASSELRTVSTSQEVGDPYSREEEATLTRLDLDLTEAAAALLKEVDALDLQYADHYSSYNVGHAWKALSLRGYSDDPTFIEKPAEMSRSWKKANPDLVDAEIRDTPLRAALPAVEAILDQIPGEKFRVRLMRLAPGGGELTRHADITDPDAGVTEGASMRLHVPLRTNPGVQFRMWSLDGDRLVDHMPVGTVTYLDTRKPHTAINDGEEERLHLVIDVASTPDLLALLGGDAPPEAVPDEIVLPDDPTVTEPYEIPRAAAAVRRPDPGRRGAVTYIVDDAREALRRLDEQSADLIFTCPPYYGLERYSDDPRDLSTMSIPEFDDALATVLAQAVPRLRPDRFAVMVLGEVRDRQGRLIDLPGKAAAAGEAAGLTLVNIARLVTPVGSLAVRAPRQFSASRVLGRTHQSVVVWVKGSRSEAARACGEVEVEDVPAEAMETPE